MTDLISRLEAAGVDEQRTVLQEVLSEAVHAGWIDLQQYIIAEEWVRVGAYESAAMLLVPEGWRNNWFLAQPGRDNGELIANARCLLHHDLSSGGGPYVNGYAATPALALAAAAVKARESEHG